MVAAPLVAGQGAAPTSPHIPTSGLTSDAHGQRRRRLRLRMDPQPEPEPYASPSPWLQGLVDKTFRVTTSDTRFFVGQLKCTDRDKNMILSQTHEYRLPSAKSVLEGVEAAAASAAGKGTVAMQLKSRYIGLVVIPGEFVVKVEVEAEEVSEKRPEKEMTSSADASVSGPSVPPAFMHSLAVV